jgi:hypothetical protein
MTLKEERRLIRRYFGPDHIVVQAGEAEHRIKAVS